jgi:hypothetical protein
MDKETSLIKKIFIGMIALIAILSLGYIYFVYLATPKDAVQNVLNGAKDGDLGKISRNASEEAVKFFSLDALKSCTADKEAYDANHQLELVNVCLLEKYQNMNIKKIDMKQLSENRATANVIIENKQQEYTIDFQVGIMDGRWTVHIK